MNPDRPSPQIIDLLALLAETYTWMDNLYSVRGDNPKGELLRDMARIHAVLIHDEEFPRNMKEPTR